MKHCVHFVQRQDQILQYNLSTIPNYLVSVILSAEDVDRNIAAASGAVFDLVWLCDTTFWKMEETWVTLCPRVISLWVIQFSQQEACRHTVRGILSGTQK